jgi:hypothetical protein
MRPTSWPVWIRIGLTAALAVAGPGVAIAAATCPGGQAPVVVCPHQHEDESRREPPGTDDRDHPAGRCVSPCCLPSGVLGTVPLDAAVVLGVPSPPVVAEDGIRAVAPHSNRRLSPFAIGPPAAV